MSTKVPKTNKGDRKGWPTIKEAKPVRLTDAKQIIVFNPLTGLDKNIKISW